MRKALTALALTGAALAAPMLTTGTAYADDAAIRRIVIPPMASGLYGCSVEANPTALRLVGLAVDPNSIAWSGSCTYVANGIQSTGHLSVSASGGGSVVSNVVCTLGSAAADYSGDEGYTLEFTHTGVCTLTAYGTGYAGASAN